MAEGLESKTERVCSRCETVKVTCHPPHGLPWLEFWRDLEKVECEATPPCDARLEVALGDPMPGRSALDEKRRAGL